MSYIKEQISLFRNFYIFRKKLISSENISLKLWEFIGSFMTLYVMLERVKYNLSRTAKILRCTTQLAIKFR